MSAYEAFPIQSRKGGKNLCPIGAASEDFVDDEAA
jgi:hypothetical protein